MRVNTSQSPLIDCMYSCQNNAVHSIRHNFLPTSYLEQILMINHPSETTALAPFQLDKIRDNLTRIFLTQTDAEYIRPTTHGKVDSDYGVYELLPSERLTDAFHLPITFATSVSDKDNRDIIVDIRPFARITPRGDTVINNIIEYRFNMDVALLTRKWMDDDLFVPEELLLKCWVRWLGTGLITKLNIEPTMQANVNIITAYYLYCMINRQDSAIDSPGLLRKVSGLIAKVTQTSTLTVYDLLEQMAIPVNNLGSYIQALSEHSGSVRFESLTPGFMFTLVQYGWYGASVIKTCSAALEYPPIFIAMVYNAIVQDGYNKTAIGRIVKDLPRADVDYFSKTVSAILHK